MWVLFTSAWANLWLNSACRFTPISSSSWIAFSNEFAKVCADRLTLPIPQASSAFAAYSGQAKRYYLLISCFESHALKNFSMTLCRASTWAHWSELQTIPLQDSKSIQVWGFRDRRRAIMMAGIWIMYTRQKLVTGMSSASKLQEAWNLVKDAFYIIF